MRTLVLGGTRFIGRAIVSELTRAGHAVTVVHRGQTEPADLPEVDHLHLSRREWPARAAQLRALQPDAVVDCLAMSREDAVAALSAIPDDAHVVVLSSQDVYRAFASLDAGHDTDAVPLDETGPLRNDRYPHRGRGEEYEFYSKRDVEEAYLARRALVLRLPATYGEHDNQRREEFILRRVRSGRRRIPIGAGGLLWTRGYVGDIARGTRLALEHPEEAGEVFNLGEERSWSMRLWATRIIEVAGAEAELVVVADGNLPADLELTSGATSQHALFSTAKARSRLGYSDTEPMAALRASVRWHLANPPEVTDADFASDDLALEHRLPRPGTA